jgi:hypothetical protein
VYGTGRFVEQVLLHLVSRVFVSSMGLGVSCPRWSVVCFASRACQAGTACSTVVTASATGTNNSCEWLHYRQTVAAAPGLDRDPELHLGRVTPALTEPRDLTRVVLQVQQSSFQLLSSHRLLTSKL